MQLENLPLSGKTEEIFLQCQYVNIITKTRLGPLLLQKE